MVRIDQHNGKRVRLGIDAAIVAQRRGSVNDWMSDGAPEIDDSEAALEAVAEVGGGEVPVHAGDGRFGGRADVRSDGGWGVSDFGLGDEGLETSIGGDVKKDPG